MGAGHEHVRVRVGGMGPQFKDELGAEERIRAGTNDGKGKRQSAALVRGDDQVWATVHPVVGAHVVVSRTGPPTIPHTPGSRDVTVPGWLMRQPPQGRLGEVKWPP